MSKNYVFLIHKCFSRPTVKTIDETEQEPGAWRETKEVSSDVSTSASSCLLCRRRDWRQLEGELWRLELWLDQADRKLNQFINQVRTLDISVYQPG